MLSLGRRIFREHFLEYLMFECRDDWSVRPRPEATGWLSDQAARQSHRSYDFFETPAI